MDATAFYCFVLAKCAKTIKLSFILFYSIVETEKEAENLAPIFG